MGEGRYSETNAELPRNRCRDLRIFAFRSPASSPSANSLADLAGLIVRYGALLLDGLQNGPDLIHSHSLRDNYLGSLFKLLGLICNPKADAPSLHKPLASAGFVRIVTQTLGWVASVTPTGTTTGLMSLCLVNLHFLLRATDLQLLVPRQDTSRVDHALFGAALSTIHSSRSACTRMHSGLQEFCARSWKRHRETCPEIREMSMSFIFERDTRFSCFLVLLDYQAHKLSLLLGKLAYIRDSQKNIHNQFTVVMEYIHGKCLPRVAAEDDWIPLLAIYPCVPHMEDTNFEGELHVVRFVDEEWPGTIEFPLLLRSETPVLKDGLERIAREIPVGMDILQLETLCPGVYLQFRALAQLKVVEVYS
ncbi:hypothetical protein C8R47DRAFT_1302483 [Mycena vitilis]|nr:hypothetical protein C8R47DRAFT_1302483 [Mycena vitilis]